MTTKRLLFTALLETILSMLTVTTVLASKYARADDCNGEVLMNQTRYRYQYRHCRNLGN